MINAYDQNEMARRIKLNRESKKLTISALAIDIGISRSLLSRVEKGERNLPMDALVACSKIFGVSTDYLLGLEDYHSIFCEESYFSTDTLEETKENIIKKYIKDYEDEDKRIQDFVHNQHGLRVPSGFELEALDVVLNKERFKHTKDTKHAIAYMLFLIKNYYLDDQEFFNAAGITMTDDDFEFLRLQFGLQFLEDKKYFKKTVQDFIKSAPDLNKIYRLINDMDSVSRKHLENFLDSSRRVGMEVR